MPIELLEPVLETTDEDHEWGEACHYVYIETGKTLCGAIPKRRKQHSPKECDSMGHVRCVVCEDLWEHKLRQLRKGGL